MMSQLTFSGSQPKPPENTWKTLNSSLFKSDPIERIARAKQADVAALVYVNKIQYIWAPVFDYGDSPTDNSKLLNVFGTAIDSTENIVVMGIEHHLMNCNMGVLKSVHLHDSLDRVDALKAEMLEKTKLSTSRDACF